MKLKFILLLTVMIMAVPTYSQEEALKKITREESEQFMKYLSSDSLKGRRTGSEGNNAAAAYISSAALEMGLKPLPGRNDLYQTLEYEKVTPIPDESKITFSDNAGNMLYSSQVVSLFAPVNEVNLNGDVVFAGYGFTDSEAKYNDLAGIPVNDKIVMIMTRTPDLQGNGMPVAGEPVSDMTEIRKLSMLLLQRAKAILLVADPALPAGAPCEFLSSISSTYQLVPLFKKMFSFSLNTYIISKEAADMLLSKSGHTLSDLQDNIASTRKPSSFTIPDMKAAVTINISKDSVSSSNVIGYIEGSDPVLKDECIIYTAHYDHLGTDSKGGVFNGANDNASGTVGLLNVARAFTSLDNKPLRSIVFLWTTGEEEGLHGSTYYVENPLFPLDKTVADINFDMIGRSRRPSDAGASLTGEIDITGRDTIKIISGSESAELAAMAKEASVREGLYPVMEGKGNHFSGSDHYPFYSKGIPAVFFFTGLHKDYHQQTDDFEFIDFEKLINVSSAGFLIGYKLASQHERMVADKTAK